APNSPAAAWGWRWPRAWCAAITALSASRAARARARGLPSCSRLLLHRNPDNRSRRPGQDRIEPPPKPYETVEYLHLTGPERLSLQDPAADVPGRAGDAVEIEDPLDMESRALHFFLQLSVRIAPVVAERHVERAEDPLVVGDQDDRAAARR